MRNAARRAQKTSNRKVVLFLLICFPYGLIQMWRKARWHAAIKVMVTACFVALTVAVLLPQTLPPRNLPGGVEMVGAQREVEVYGPELPASLDENYAGYGAVDSAAPVFAQVEEVDQVYVYANDNGSYYHRVDCQYVAWYSKKYTLPVAYYSNYLPCEVCDAPVYTPGSGA